MELRDLSYFLACVDSGSVTAAARQVHAAQPTISHALARLESELGVRVLERGARAPLRVTEAGQRLAQRARQALAALAAVRPLRQHAGKAAELEGHVGFNRASQRL